MGGKERIEGEENRREEGGRGVLGRYVCMCAACMCACLCVHMCVCVYFLAVNITLIFFLSRYKSGSLLTVLRTKPSFSCMLDKYFTTELCLLVILLEY